MGQRIVLIGLSLSLLLASVRGAFVFVEVVGRTPAVDLDQEKFGCSPAAFTGEDRSLLDIEGKVANPENACTTLQGSYDGIVIIVKRGGCTFKTKVQHAQAAGSAAIIVVNDEPDFPVQMRISEGKADPDQRYDDEMIEQDGIGIPACMTFSDSWELLAGVGVSGLRLSFGGFRKYFKGNERVPENDITGVGILQQDGSFHNVPAAQATFNPVVNSIVGMAKRVELDSKCLDRSTCDACWILDQQISNHQELDSNVAVFYLDPGVESCMMWMFEITVLVQEAGSTALVFVNVDETLWTWIPWLVPFDLTIPTFNVLRSDGRNVLGRLALGEELEIKTPALQSYPAGCRPDLDVCISSGPRFRDDGTTSLPLTGLLFVDYSEEDEPFPRMTTAGQALFNPLEVASASIQNYFAFHAPVAVTYFPEKCSLDVALGEGEGACSACTDDSDVLSKMGALDGRVALIKEEDIGCLGAWKNVVEGATALGAVAVVFGAGSDRIGSLTADSQYRSAIPAFVIGQEDARWLYERAERFSNNPWDAPTRRSVAAESGRRDRQLGGVIAFMPKIEEGAAPAYDQEYAMASHALMEREARGEDPGEAPTPAPPSLPSDDDLVRMTRISFTEGLQQYSVTAAVARFMSPTYPSVVGGAVWLSWWYCGSLDTCGACQRYMCEDIANQEDIKGNVALIWDHDIPCFGPPDVVQAVHCAQELGATGVVFVSDSGVTPMGPAENGLPSYMEPTLCLDGRYRSFCMPVFSVSGIAAISLRNHVTCASARDGEKMACQRTHSSNPEIRIELPGHHSNPSPFGSAGVFTGDGYLSTADAQQKETQKEFPDWGIAVLVVALTCTLLACALAVCRMRKRRTAAMTSATQEVTQSMIEDDEVEDGAVVIQADPARFRPGYAEPASGLAKEAVFNPSDYAKSKLGFPDGPGKSEEGVQMEEAGGTGEVDLESQHGEPGQVMEGVELPSESCVEVTDGPARK